MSPTNALSSVDAAHLNTLRAELKQWEKLFSDANGGKKAGRQDIKQDPEIAAKYKTYGRLRALESSSTNEAESGPKDGTKTPSKLEQQQARGKHKHGGEIKHHGQTPPKSQLELFTPAKNRTINDPHHPAELDPYDSPSVFRRLFSPSTHRQTQQSPLPFKNAIGPTPQRDGKALGLFDSLSASGGSTATPSAQRVAMVGKDVMKTPSGGKRKRLEGISEQEAAEDEDEERAVHLGRTPASSSKKLYLERFFATPTTLRFAMMVENEGNERTAGTTNKLSAAETHSDSNPLGSETPSFLRRSNSGRYIPNPDPSNGLSPIGIRKTQRFVGKGLSALVQGLRDMDKERMQDDWDILRDIEAEQQQNGADVQVGDSQAPVLNRNDPEGESWSGRIWKKKAPKRTTRLVKLKPVVHTKPKQAKTTAKETNKKAEAEESEDELFSGAVPVPSESTSRRKPQNDKKHEGGEEEEGFISDNSSDSDFAKSSTKTEPASSFSEKIKAAISSVKTPLTNPSKSATSKSKKKAKPQSNEHDQETEKATKRRKINPDAHANYRSLKIRSIGQRRFGKGRFGRR
ncbi:DNA replication/checkpoint protein [Talaromyces proteolyticus]|uniref:DNA replication regulator SLD2 n=1 Tax=Talaromyces proteolyticus TaxID=1131652 RepID=A0AAD4KLM1_9EURO|nr:DNA replication/checkpoint protein [Talaromyces proteolyticus]KAH8693921.1 DNA replication/checkpoint protein [Talaromyces proteolyticus]